VRITFGRFTPPAQKEGKKIKEQDPIPKRASYVSLLTLLVGLFTSIVVILNQVAYRMFCNLITESEEISNLPEDLLE